jgi:serine/threonine protein kinase
MMGGGYTYKADIWSLGILICDLVGGFTPFSGKALENNDHFQSSENGGRRGSSPNKNGSIDPRMMIEMANAGRLSLPKNLNNVTRDLIKQILVADPNQRYGIEEIKDHKFFRGVNWEKVAQRQLQPPYIPPIPSFLTNPD